MSRATDAFSSLISDVPGVDTSCFIKRSLNDLKTQESSSEVESSRCTLQTEADRNKTEIPASTDVPVVSYASFDLDGLGKPSTPKATAHTVAPLEDLFEDIPGCEQPVFTQREPECSPELEPEVEPLSEEPEPMPPPMPHSEPERVVQFMEPETEPIPEPPLPEELDLRPSSDFRNRFGKYKTTFNKKAGDLKKKGLKAMKQGLGAAQEWMDKVVEERKQSSLTASQKREEARQIEQFLAEMELLSHHRREQLMADLPADFFQKVIDYAEAKGLSIEHLFITSQDEMAPQEELEMELEQPSLRHEPQEDAYLDVTGEDSLEAEEEEEEEDYDLLGLSHEAPSTQPVAQDEAPSPKFASPDDLDAFFTGGVKTDPAAVPVQVSSVLVEDGDLMAFERGSSSQVKSDFTSMYQRLKAGGQHSEAEIRAILKQRRQQEHQDKMAAALQAKVEREREVEATQELHRNLKEAHLQSIVTWKEQHANNMRGLLTTLHTVLWEDSGWRPLTVGDVLEASQVKKAYMKANLIIHPDKVKQKGGTAEQVVLADMVFNVLKEGWQKFQS